MQLKDIMTTEVKTVSQEDSLVIAARKMRDANVGCLVVMNGGRIVGVITDRDLVVRCLCEAHDPWGCQVYQHMSKPATTAEPSMDIVRAAHIMSERKIRRLPIVAGNQPVGIVSFSDIARAMERTMHDLLAGMGAARAGA